MILQGFSLANIFYFCYGILISIYFYILFSPKREKSKNLSKESYVKKLYLNIYFMDRKEIIRNIIRSKVPKNRPVIRALAKRAAVALLEKGFVERVATGLCNAIPERMDLMGIKVNVNLSYTEQAYACVELTLLGLDLHKFFSFNAGKDKALGIKRIMDTYSIPAINNWIERSLLEFMSGKLISSLPATMKEKLFVKMNAEVEIIACTEEEQGPYLVQTIAQLNYDLQKENTTQGTQNSAGIKEESSVVVTEVVE